MSLPRRELLRLAFGAGLLPAAALARTKATPLETARDLVARHAGRVAHDDMIAMVDYGAPSWEPRFHLVDLARATVSSFLVAHGRGSDPEHTGWLKSFSNAVGSNASSAGAYRTGGIYEGKYGRSMRLEGLDAENSNAMARAIVIHPAWYVSEAMLKRYGKLGRSEGCFTLTADGLDQVLGRLGADRLLFAGRLS